MRNHHRILIKMGSYVLAADFGTSSLKLGLFSENSEYTHSAPGRYAYGTASPRVGWVEQQPSEWWAAFRRALRDILKVSHLKREDISCISIGAHMGLVCVDGEGRPLRPSILFYDQRSAAQCEQINGIVSQDLIERICGNRVSTVQTATQLLWLRENEPGTFNATRYFMMTPGYIAYLLTDRASYDYTHASWTALFDIRQDRWSDELLQVLKLPAEKLPEAMPSTAILGHVSSRAAEQTGLRSGTPVMVGGSDTPLAALAEGVTVEGRALITAGSVSSIVVCTAKPDFSSTLLNRCHVVPNRWLMQGAMNAHGNLLKWVADEFYQAGGPRNNVYERISRDVKASPAGSRGLIFLPYLSGERSPIWDPYARGVLFGFSFHHGRRDIARAAYEGVTYAARHNLETIERLGVNVNELMVVGGGATDDVWNQIKADILHRRIIVSKGVNASLMGSGRLGCYGAGWTHDLLEPPGDTPKRIFLPRLRYSERYTELFRIYRELYEDLRDTFREAQRLQES